MKTPSLFLLRGCVLASLSSLFLLRSFLPVHAAEDTAESVKAWLPAAVYEVPQWERMPEMDVDDVQAILYEGVPYQGHKTQVFAYLGLPEGAGAEAGKQVPAVVCVHGGGGTAFWEWVKVWNAHGYAAISMDLEGRRPESTEGLRTPKVPLENGGPARAGRWEDIGLPLDQQWPYHAASQIMLAHSLIDSLPEVDATRTAVTGISWGGVMSSTIAGLDERFQCAVPVYGCGFLYDSVANFHAMGSENDPEALEKKKFWDPARFFQFTKMPTLWVNGDQDGHFSVDIFSRSKEAAEKGSSTLCIHPAMSHGHGPGWDPKTAPEIYVFVDSILKGGDPLAKVVSQPQGRQATLRYESSHPIVKSTLHYLETPLLYENRKKFTGIWLSKEASVDGEKKEVTVEVPESATMYYLNIEDDRGCLVSSNLVKLPSS